MSTVTRALLGSLPLLLVATANVAADDQAMPAQTGTQQTQLPGKPQVYARFFTSPSEIREELATHEIAPRLYFGTEVEGEADYTKQGGASESDAFADSLVTALRWVPFYGLTGLFEGSYDLNHSEGFTVDEATMTLGAVPSEPWYVSIGRTELPFGEFNSHFTEDPTTQVLGEIQGREVAGGYESDRFELTFAARPGDSGSQSYSWIGNMTFSPVQDVDVGVYYASDLSKSFEVHQLIDDARDEDPGLAAKQSPVKGAGAFMSLQKYNYSVDFECITALEDFNEGFLDDSPQRPWAWNLEATTRPTNLWEVGVRLERSSGLPESPEVQYGVETSYSFGTHAAVRLDYLHGMFASSDLDDRDLITATAVLRW
jgi:hypothetical protein